MKLYTLHLYNTAHFPKLVLDIPEDNAFTVMSDAQTSVTTTIWK